MSEPIFEYNPEIIAALERERSRGMPRWHVRETFTMIITGSRDWEDRLTLFAALDEVLAKWIRDHGQPNRVIFRHGKCRGADMLGDEWAYRHGFVIDAMPAEDYGPWPSCGPIRNQEMINKGGDRCVAFPMPGTRGTADCVKWALNAGIPVSNYGTVPVMGIQPRRAGIL